MELLAYPWTAEDGHFTFLIQFTQASADFLTDGHDPMHRIFKEGLYGIGIHAAKLHPEGGRLKGFLLGGFKPCRSDDISIAGTVHNSFAAIGRPSCLILYNDVGDTSLLSHAICDKGMVKKGHAAFQQHALCSQFQGLIINKHIAAFQVGDSTAQRFRPFHQLKGHAVNNLLAFDTEFTDRGNKGAGGHASHKAIAFD